MYRVVTHDPPSASLSAVGRSWVALVDLSVWLGVRVQSRSGGIMHEVLLGKKLLCLVVNPPNMGSRPFFTLN